MAYLFDHADAAERRETQYFEMVCNRGIYHKGWTAVTRHSMPWLFGATLPALDDDVWELYDTTTDWTQAHDLSAEHPDKLAELQRLFLIEAVKYNVLPLDDRRIERFNSEIAGRPQLAKGPSQILFGGMSRVTENTVLNLKNKSYAVTAEVDVPDGGANGVIVAQGGAFGGWSLYLLDGVPTYCYNLLGLALVKATGTDPSRPAPTRSGWSSPTTEAVWPRGATPRCTWTATRSASARQEASIPMLFSGDETLDLGGGPRHVGERRLHPETSRSPGRSTGSSWTRGTTTIRTCCRPRTSSRSPWCVSRPGDAADTSTYGSGGNCAWPHAGDHGHHHRRLRVEG